MRLVRMANRALDSQPRAKASKGSTFTEEIFHSHAEARFFCLISIISIFRVLVSFLLFSLFTIYMRLVHVWPIERWNSQPRAKAGSTFTEESSFSSFSSLLFSDSLFVGLFVFSCDAIDFKRLQKM
jgi:hypothetical protein